MGGRQDGGLALSGPGAVALTQGPVAYVTGLSHSSFALEQWF